MEILLWYTKKFPKAAKELFGFDKNHDVVSEELVKPLVDFIEVLQLKI